MPGSHTARLAARATVSSRLSKLDDGGLFALIESGERLGTGIGGGASLLQVDGVKVFVKRVPLTDLELRPEHRMSTANVFGLPTCYHYGIGSTGFGAWRELAAHSMADDWVTAGEHLGFPLLHHWRVLRGSPPGDSVFAEFGNLADAVSFWDDSIAVRHRLEAIRDSTASLVLFLEFIPWTLTEWLGDQPIDTYARVLTQLSEGVEFLRDRGFVHFDAHFDNIVTDGDTLYFSDFGLALSSRFQLSHDEADFRALHRDYDVHYTTTQLVNRLAERVCDRAELGQFVRDCASGRRPTRIPASAAILLDQQARTANCLNEFHRTLIDVSKQTSVPGRGTRSAARLSWQRVDDTPGETPTRRTS